MNRTHHTPADLLTEFRNIHERNAANYEASQRRYGRAYRANMRAETYRRAIELIEAAQ